MTQVVLLIASLFFVSPPQTSTTAQGPDLLILSTQIKLVSVSANNRVERTAARAVSVPAEHRQTASAFDSLDDMADQVKWKKYRISITVRNHGIKSIRSVTFEYPLVYSYQRKRYKRFSFKVKQEVKPGETLTLSRSFVSTKTILSRSYEEAIPTRIEFQDGSVWRR